MMFLIRTAFWLTVLILLLPTDDRQRSEVYGTAEAAVRDVTTFCDRNPETCAKGRDAFSVFMQKAQFGASMLMGLIKDETGSNGDASASLFGSEPATTAEPASFDMSGSKDTLNPEDRQEAWSGPDRAGT
jgi:hypothetical protein